ncbi:hypothetical protein [Paenibacillus wynnii]|uniref:hypothetical protein n=1 Tax=Paenibacillus wynnii TaxID=268407 RepID=UPI00278E894C|nr:hypothetical protein [Paenibacillus wynnii]MDQ0194264.1 hypothetical protein [Paenibacillus wynnii]
MIKNIRAVGVLSLIIIVLSVAAAGFGLFSSGGTGEYSFTSIRGETVQIYGKGLYSHESVSMAAQARAQDGVTLFLGIPLLILSLIMTVKGLIKGRLMLTGTLGFFLYTYASYSFLAMYNSMFLVYVALFSTSLFAFILSITSFDKSTLHNYFNDKLPAKSIGAFLWFIGFVIAMMWLGKIVNPLIEGSTPDILQHYTTLTIQAMDLAIIVPLAVITGYMVIRRQAFGYLLASVVIIKGVSLLTSISAMLGAMIYAGVDVSPVEAIIFPVFNAGIIVCFIILLKNVRETGTTTI